MRNRSYMPHPAGSHYQLVSPLYLALQQAARAMQRYPEGVSYPARQTEEKTFLHIRRDPGGVAGEAAQQPQPRQFGRERRDLVRGGERRPQPAGAAHQLPAGQHPSSHGGGAPTLTLSEDSTLPSAPDPSTALVRKFLTTEKRRRVGWWSCCRPGWTWCTACSLRAAPY